VVVIGSNDVTTLAARLSVCLSVCVLYPVTPFISASSSSAALQPACLPRDAAVMLADIATYLRD